MNDGHICMWYSNKTRNKFFKFKGQGQIHKWKILISRG